MLFEAQITTALLHCEKIEDLEKNVIEQISALRTRIETLPMQYNLGDTEYLGRSIKIFLTSGKFPEDFLNKYGELSLTTSLAASLYKCLYTADVIPGIYVEDNRLAYAPKQIGGIIELTQDNLSKFNYIPPTPIQTQKTSILISFYRANAGNQMVNSIIPLISEIVNYCRSL